MKVLNNLDDIFYQNIPVLDLHGVSLDLAFSLVNEFIDDNIALDNEKIIIVHGIGQGIMKNEVYDNFKKDKRILDMNLMENNPGSSLIYLNKHRGS